MIILLNYTIESRSIHTIKKQTNTIKGLELINQHYNRLGTENVYHYMVKHVIDNPELYGDEVSILVKEGRYSEAVDLTAKNERTMLHFGHMFDAVYNKAFADLVDVESKLIITLPHNTTKPSNVDLFIGWAVPESDFEVDHMEEHEGIKTNQGRYICQAHNDWMVSNSNIYDVFFHHSSHNEVIDYINSI